MRARAAAARATRAGLPASLYLCSLRSLTGARLAARPQSVDEEKHWCLGYPLYAGGSLWEALVCRNGEKPLSAAQRCRVALCAARGMAAMHEARQVHHDVKSGNVLLAAGGDVAVLGDTGASFPLPPGVNWFRDQQPAENHGYPCWRVPACIAAAGCSSLRPAAAWLTGAATLFPPRCRAPEFVARGEVRPACDVYAFGVVLCELLSNKPAVMPKEGEKARPARLLL